MIEHEPETQTMKISEVKAALSRLVNEVYRKERRILIEKSGIPVAALVAVADLDRLTQWEREKAARRKAIEVIGAAFADVPFEEIEAQLARIATEGARLDEIEPTRKSA